jgi:hypothetical protein
MPYIGKQPANVPVTADDIPANSIDASKIIDGAITIADIADDAVTADKLANSINTDIATGVTASTTAGAALPKGGGTMTGTTAHGDNIKSRYGTNADLEIYHDGSHSYIDDSSGTGRLILKTDYLEVQNAAGNEAILGGIQDGAVSLYHNGLAKLATTAAGVAVTGGVGIGTTSAAGFNLDLQDSNYGVRIRAVPASKFVQIQLPTDEGSAVDTEKFIIAYNNAHSTHPHMVALKSNNSAGTVGFFTNSAERLRIDSDGLKFNGDTATANALNDYEEGAWTPTIEAASGNAATLTVGSAMYTKIGRQVNVTAYIHSIDLTAMTSGSYILLKGLPYTSQDYSDFSIGYRDAGYSNSVIVGGYVQSGQSFAYFMHGGGGEAQQGSTFTFGKCMINITYPST